MATRKALTIGDEQEALLKAAIQQLAHAPLAGARGLPELTGLHAAKQMYTDPQDNVLLRAIGFLNDSSRVYLHGGDVVYESAALSGEGQSLTHLRIGNKIEFGAEYRLANVFTCLDGPNLFPPPGWFTRVMLSSDLIHARLPRIRTYARRPVFDDNYNLCSPGWHPSSGILVHGPHIEPMLPENVAPGTPALARLPHHLRTLLADFCFKTDADVANALSMFLTGMLANHFVEEPKGLFLVDGNQPDLGKTWLVRCVGLVLDGFESTMVTFTSDDAELAKTLCATLRGTWQSLAFIDNAKTATRAVINSQVIEANCVAPEVSLRILGKSEVYKRPNDLLWAITMNDTRVSPDLTSRGVPIQLAYEGRTESRSFTGPHPIAYALEHRLEILGELAGIILKWNQAGRTPGLRPHRCRQWAREVGGVLTVAGFPEFLANAASAAATFNVQLDHLAALAEAVVKHNGPFVESPTSFQE